MMCVVCAVRALLVMPDPHNGGAGNAAVFLEFEARQLSFCTSRGGILWLQA
jgi:hypothetical protein